MNTPSPTQETLPVHEPLVSVVTPCYNSATYLRQCLESVQQQTYPHIEHIVQDGNSTDSTRAILEEYGSRLKWISERDAGQADGLNRALQRSTGSIIVVLNADDELLPDACAWAVQQFRDNPDVGVIYGDQHNVGPDGEPISDFLGPAPYDFEQIFCVEKVIPAQAAFIRRKAFEAVGFHADASLPTCPDYEMWVRLGMSTPMMHSPAFLCNYRWHPGSEGQQADIVVKMVASKRSVMERVWNSPDCPPHLKKIQKRALSGLCIWAGGTLIDIKCYEAAIQYLMRGVRLRPCLGTYYQFVMALINLPFWHSNAMLRGFRLCVLGVGRVGKALLLFATRRKNL